MMKPKYKVGDIVTIKKVRKGDHSDYRFGFMDDMIEEGGGKSYKIRSIEKATCSNKPIPDDGYLYKLDGIHFSWASSMFEDSSEPLSLETPVDNNLDAFIAKKKCPKLDFTL